MPVTAAPAEERVLLNNTSWETYERLLSEHVNSTGTRFTYDSGVLEIMVVYAGHENPNRTLSMMVEIAAEETRRDLYPSGSTTFKSEVLQKGFEPDSSFYFDSVAKGVRGKKELDLSVDPPPGLVIEVDMSRSSLNRLPIFASVGVSEVWRYDGSTVRIYRLRNGAYAEMLHSEILPPLTAGAIKQLLADNSTMERYAWIESVRQWVRDHA